MIEMSSDGGHRTDLHRLAEVEHGTSLSIEMRQQSPPSSLGRTGLEVVRYDPVILASAELVATLRQGMEGVGGWVRDDTLRIVADNAELTYRLELAPCGCWLGRLVTGETAVVGPDQAG